MRYILLLSSINFGTEISKRLLLRGPDGHWGSRHYTVRLFILCGYIFSEYVMNRKNSKCNQCDFSSHCARVLSRHIKHGKIAKLPWYHNFGLSWYCQWGHSCCRSCRGLSWHRSCMSLDKSCSQLRVNQRNVTIAILCKTFKTRRRKIIMFEEVTYKNIAKGQTSRAVTPFHFFDCPTPTSWTH